MCRAVLAPLKPALWMRLHTLRAQELRRLRRRQIALRAGAGPEGQRPAPALRSRIHARLAHLHAACSPRRKVALLLAVCSDVYAGLAGGENQGKGGVGVCRVWSCGRLGTGRVEGASARVASRGRAARPVAGACGDLGIGCRCLRVPTASGPDLSSPEPLGADAFLPALTEELIWSPHIGETQLDVEFLMELLDPEELRGEGEPALPPGPQEDRRASRRGALGDQGLPFSL